jgi:hypothetical protein
MSDLIAPPAATSPAEAVELVCTAISDGDLECALAQYERGAVLRLWAHERSDCDDLAGSLARLMELRLPLSVGVRDVLWAGGVALVLAERRIVGTTPDCRRIDLRGIGGTTVRRQVGGRWRIAADAWLLSGPDGGSAD